MKFYQKILSFLIIAMLCYLSFAFVIYEPDPAKWTLEARGFLISCCVLVMFYYLMFFILNDSEK